MRTVRGTIGVLLLACSSIVAACSHGERSSEGEAARQLSERVIGDADEASNAYSRGPARNENAREDLPGVSRSFGSRKR